MLSADNGCKAINGFIGTRYHVETKLFLFGGLVWEEETLPILSHFSSFPCLLHSVLIRDAFPRRIQTARRGRKGDSEWLRAYISSSRHDCSNSNLRGHHHTYDNNMCQTEKRIGSIETNRVTGGNCGTFVFSLC